MENKETGLMCFTGEFDVFYVKFQDRAYIHCQWLKRSEILELEGGEQALQRFERRSYRIPLSPSISIDNLLVFEDQEIDTVTSPKYEAKFAIVEFFQRLKSSK